MVSLALLQTKHIHLNGNRSSRQSAGDDTSAGAALHASMGQSEWHTCTVDDKSWVTQVRPSLACVHAYPTAHSPRKDHELGMQKASKGSTLDICACSAAKEAACSTLPSQKRRARVAFTQTQPDAETHSADQACHTTNRGGSV